MIKSDRTMRAAVTSLVVFALITSTICCSGEEDSRQKEQNNLMTGGGSGQQIYIRDPQLYSLVRQAVGTEGEFVTDTQMAMLQELIAVPHFTLESGVDPEPIFDLEGLEFATGLIHLDLSGHHLIDDITPHDWQLITPFHFDSYAYSPLDTLDTLDIEIIYAINHKYLVQFTANFSNVDDLTPLARLTNLEDLFLYIKDTVDGLPLCALKMTTIRSSVELDCK